MKNTKKILAVLLCALMVISLAACGSGSGSENNQGGNDPQQGNTGENNQNTGGNNNQQGNNGSGQGSSGNNETPEPLEVNSAEAQDSMMVLFSRLPACSADLEKVDFKNEYQVAASVIAALCYYEKDPSACYDMMNTLKGPESISEFDKSFIKEQFSQYPYVARSYIDGARPDNDYTYEMITFTVSEGPYSRTEEGYVELWFRSGGADSPRAIKLRQKASTGEWFLFSDTYKGLLAGIRQPESSDPWN